MSSCLNRAQLIGNVGRDPETKHFQNGGSCVHMSLATSETWKDKTTGEKRERVQWHSIVIFNENLLKIAQQYIKKGSKIMVEGQIENRKWKDQSGNDRSVTEIVLRPFNGTLVLLGDSKGSQSAHSDYAAPAPAAASDEAYDDEVPF
jgi:single-strand DNA-binding protein